MDTDNNDIKHYTAEDIARYWQGNLSPQEMHAMEKAAMDDPFLADALEGYSNMQQTAVAADLRELRGRLQERSDTRVVPMRRRWWSVAAAIILLCGLGMLTYTLIQNDRSSVNKFTQAQPGTKKDTPANAVVPQTQKDTISAVTGSTFANISDSAAYLSTNKLKDIAAQKPAGEFKDQPGARDSLVDAALSRRKNVSRSDVDAEKQRAQDSLLIASNDKVADRLQGKVEGLKTSAPANVGIAPPVSRENADQYRLSVNNFQGRVLDRNNEPIANASVRVYNNAQLAATDPQGNFQIRSFDSVLNLSVSSVGYESRQLTMRNSQPQDVVLDPSKNKLDEVVVTGYGDRDKKRKESRGSTTLKVFVMDAQPVISWDEYNLYIEKNRRIDSVSRLLAKGEVVVSFNVSKTGKLSNFNIEKSLGKFEDAEAIRLIKEGPAWRVLKDKKTKARVIVPF